MTTSTATKATTEERKVLADLLDLFQQAKGDAPALADVRRQISEQIDGLVAIMRSCGVDTDSLLDELDEEAGR